MSATETDPRLVTSFKPYNRGDCRHCRPAAEMAICVQCGGLVSGDSKRKHLAHHDNIEQTGYNLTTSPSSGNQSDTTAAAAPPDHSPTGPAGQ